MTDRSGPRLTDSLTEAWMNRAARAAADHRAAQKALALFKPEWSERAEREYRHAMTQAGAVSE